MLRLTEGRFLSLYTGPWFHNKVDALYMIKWRKNLSLREDKCTKEEEDMSKQGLALWRKGWSKEDPRPPSQECLREK